MPKILTHLEQEKLDGSKAVKLLNEFGEWLDSVKFDKKEEDNFEHCVDAGMDEACQSLLKDLDLYKKASISCAPVPSTNPLSR